MIRNLDLTALRAFLTVADIGGVTRAAGHLNLTQSAVSMQIKRLEEALDLKLFDRVGRTVQLTASGAQLVGYARKMLALNDEAWSRLTAQEFEGELVLGVPHDVIYPYIPPILKRFSVEFPRMRIRLISSATRTLREMFAKGDCDLILTTEDQAAPGGETLIELPLVWNGAIGGTVWRERPLRVAFCSKCIFRDGVLRALEVADVPWEMAVESDLDNAVEAAVSADLAIHATILGQCPPGTQPIDHAGELPKLPPTRINLYVQRAQDSVNNALAQMIRDAYTRHVDEPASLALTG